MLRAYFLIHQGSLIALKMDNAEGLGQKYPYRTGVEGADRAGF